jgi:hypothetical protein
VEDGSPGVAVAADECVRIGHRDGEQCQRQLVVVGEKIRTATPKVSGTLKAHRK